MKNIHLIPTEKPSRLYYKDDKYKLANSTMAMDWYISSAGYKPTNIYITSDEEIKEGDWCFDIFLDAVFQANWFMGIKTKNTARKIILTTDPNLIADGVQAIDDEFLEWFVKNPSCESIEVKKRYSEFTVEPFVGYKIIIPQEEPKHISAKPFLDNADEVIVIHRPKQETLEEAAANLADPNICKTDNWIAGAKWQAKRMYSEEELKYAIEVSVAKALGVMSFTINEESFEQFKKK